MKWDDNGHFKIVLEFNSVSENVCVTTAIIAEVRSRALFHQILSHNLHLSFGLISLV